MIMKIFSCIVFCVLIFRPAVIVNSQSVNMQKVKLLHEKEAENRELKMKIEANEKQINYLLGQLIETKTEVKKRSPIYKRIFTHRNKKKVLTTIITDPVPVNDADTVLLKIDTVETLTPAVPIMQTKHNFFERIFKIFKHKK